MNFAQVAEAYLFENLGEPGIGVQAGDPGSGDQVR